MVLVVLARDGVLFSSRGRSMSLTSYFLVTFRRRRRGARGGPDVPCRHAPRNGLPACLLRLVRGVGRLAGLRRHRLDPNPASARALFLLAVVGFGTKAGFIPLHVWLPEAHSAAPSRVSAVMSGEMVSIGIYGLVRALTYLPPATWSGWLLIPSGTSSGIWGVLFALAQHDLKRLARILHGGKMGIVAPGLGMESRGRFRAPLVISASPVRS